MEDKNFDALADKFARKIYSNNKGEIRLAVLWAHLSRLIPEFNQAGPRRILDIGGGMGQLSLRLLALGYEVLLCDPSEKMLDHAREAASLLPPDQQQRLTIQRCTLQQAANSWNDTFDIVLCHAVLEWLAEPLSAIQDLNCLVKPGGHLSLMFYNLHSINLRNLIRGNFKKVKSGELAGYKNSLTPINPLEPEDVYSALTRSGFIDLGRAGVRVFSDYLTREISENRSFEDTLELEMQFSAQEPYISIARYIHVMAKKPSPP